MKNNAGVRAMIKKIFCLCFVACVLSDMAYAGEAATPPAGQKFYSLTASRNMASRNRPYANIAPRFFPLRQGQRPGALTVPSPAAPRTESARLDAPDRAAPATIPAAADRAKPTVNQQQAQQLLSLFSAAD